MGSLDLSNKFLRMYAVVTDQFGIDALSDKVVPGIQAIEIYTSHEVTQDERGSPDLISAREYGDDCYWWHIMAYNGIGRIAHIVEGATLRIPNLGSIVAVTNSMLTNRSSVNNIVEI